MIKTNNYSLESFELLKAQLCKYYYRHKEGKFKNFALEDKIDALRKFANNVIEQFAFEGEIDPSLLDECIHL